MPVALAVEGPTDRAAAEKILSSRSLSPDPGKTFVKRGKGQLDPSIGNYNQAARHFPWLVLRDADHDGGDCPARLRELLVPHSQQSPAFCLRFPVRSLESWLLGDAEAFSDTFAVPHAAVPTNPETLNDPKRALVDACRRSTRRAVRQAMVPPQHSSWLVGPEYTTLVVRYCSDAWRPDVASASAPSLARALADIDRLVAAGLWA